MLILASVLSSSPDKCGALPVPAEAKLKVFFCARANNSFTDVTGSWALTAKIMGNSAKAATGTRSLKGS